MAVSKLNPVSGGLAKSDLSLKWASIGSVTGNNTSGTLTVSSIPATYDRLKIVLSGVRHNGSPSGSASFEVRINGSTTANDYTGSGVISLGTLADGINGVSNQFFEIEDYASSMNVKKITMSRNNDLIYGYQNTSAITSVSVVCAQNINAGTMTVWGGAY
jgi:hypothetical protein